MKRTTATCIAGMRGKTTSRSRIHFLRREDFRFFAFGVGIFAKRLRWRPERNPVVMTCCYGSLTTFEILFKNKAFEPTAIEKAIRA
jgi:hypothetical protein